MQQQPNILEVEEIKFIGMDIDHNVHESAAGADPGAQLWAKFGPRSEEVPNSLKRFVGVCGPIRQGGISNYTAAMQVSDTANVPPGMVAGTLPAGRYAQFIHQGPIAKVWETVDFIHNHWMPNAGYKDHDCRQVEVYSWGTDVHSEEFKFEILVPLS